jgi:anti-sigma B factor antagonist
MPPSQATVREIGPVTVVDLSGLLRLGESSAVLRNAVSELIQKERRKIILNFRDVTEIDSAGVGELVAAYTAIKKHEGRLTLLNPPKKICDMLELTRLSKVLEVFNKEDAALRSFD